MCFSVGVKNCTRLEVTCCQTLCIITTYTFQTSIPSYLKEVKIIHKIIHYQIFSSETKYWDGVKHAAYLLEKRVKIHEKKGENESCREKHKHISH